MKHKLNILAIALALSTSSAYAVSTCDTMPTKQQQNNCWSNVITDEYQQADEYVIAVEESKKVPAVVKAQVEAKRQEIAPAANHDCRKDSLGYPENACLINHIQRFKEFTYQKTSKYGVRDKRLD
ncbi:hypothetical protein KY49_4591 [Burkholderia sp. MSHR3999]|uniref:hypothetical protein n=1 Tax=Burkholderia sp. MSHR3999 TaxID=1542965 RepID=UPI0005B6F9B6|nr:hypothetical protein [Burkholderia sp. MSHR3999]KIP15790.1 hypothetical protein KY49_4591 [Burkholderia sp. MSHR3999]